MSIAKKIALGGSLLTGGSITVMEGTVLWYGEDEGGLKKILEREYAEVVPSSVKVKLTPNKLTYSINQMLSLTSEFFDSNGDKLPKQVSDHYQFAYKSSRPFVVIDGSSALLKGTGKALIEVCATPKPSNPHLEESESEPSETTKDICSDIELLIIDDSLPF
jgi:hypothetical protein